MVEHLTLAQLREHIAANPELILVDALPDYHYRHSHLPGAVNLEAADVQERAAALLPDTAAEIVVYGTDGADVAEHLVALGYTKVRHYPEGKVAWMSADLPTEGYGKIVEAIPEPAGGDQPIACNLTLEQMAGADEGLAAYRRLGRDALLSVEREPRRAVLRFRRDPQIRTQVEALVAAESRCCAFLGFDVADGPEATVLTLTAPEGGEQVMADLVDIVAGSEVAA
jgi:rhodanese-related sulfurtransferase